MSNGDDVLDNWEEIDESGLSKTLETKLRTTEATESKEEKQTVGKMKLLQRPQSQPSVGQHESHLQSPSSSANQSSPKQLIIAKKPTTTTTTTDDETSTPVLMVLHKSGSEYEAATYATPISNQTVKILRRPAQAEERRDTNGLKPKQPIKTLKQREQEYAEARLRILGEAKNPEDDEENSSAAAGSTAQVGNTPTAATSAAPTSTGTPQAAVGATTITSQLTLPAASNSSNHNNSSNNNNNPHPGMHRSSSAPKMSQTSSSYGNYNSYFPGPHNAGLNYFYQHAGTQQTPQPPLQPHFNQFMPPYGSSGAGGIGGGSVGGGAIGVGGLGGAGANAQQSWSPVVGGSVSAALLRQQSMQTPPHHHQQQQHQHQHQQQQQQSQHPYNDNILRLPRGPCPNGSFGFQMRR